MIDEINNLLISTTTAHTGMPYLNLLNFVLSAVYNVEGYSERKKTGNGDLFFEFFSYVILMGILLIISVLIYEIIKIDYAEKPRLSSLPEEIDTALAKAQAATMKCVKMQRAAVIAQAAYSAAGIDPTRWKREDGPPDIDLLIKAKKTSMKALDELKKLSIEGVKLNASPEYSGLRTFTMLSCISCEECSQSLGQQPCPAAVILNKIELT